MALYRDEGVVLRTQKLGEADRIITALTREHGLIRCVAKGVRRTTSKFGARLEPFCHVDVQLYEGRTLDVVTQAEAVREYGRDIAADYGKYTAACAIVETAERVAAVERDPSVQQYSLVLGALRALARGAHHSGSILDAYLLRALAVAGWGASFHDCARCASPGPHRGFAVAAGGVVCPDCRPAGATAPAPETMVLMGALLAGDWQTADAATERARREASGLTAAYLQWHLERGVRSLRLVERT